MNMYEISLFHETGCHTVVEAAAEAVASPGFVPTRIRFDSSTEVPLEDISPEVSTRAQINLPRRSDENRTLQCCPIHGLGDQTPICDSDFARSS